MGQDEWGYKGNGYTYRMETLGEIEPRGAFAIWDYCNNSIVTVKQFHSPMVIKLEKKITLSLKNPTISSVAIDINSNDLDLNLRANRFTSSEYSLKQRGQDYAHFTIHINYGLIITLAILALTTACCIGLCCCISQLYRKFMGIDKKPRMRTKSYVSSVESTIKASQEELNVHMYD